MNELELGILIEQALGEITDREVTSITTQRQSDPDGSCTIFLVIDNKSFSIQIREEK